MPNDTEILIKQITDLGVNITQSGDVASVIKKPTEFLKWLEKIKAALVEKDRQDSANIDIELGSKDKNREIERLKYENKELQRRIYDLRKDNIDYQNQYFWLQNEATYWRLKYFDRSNEPNYVFNVRGPVHVSNHIQEFTNKLKSTKQFDL